MTTMNNSPRSDIESAIWEICASVMDPEIPVVSIADLGVLREVAVDDQGAVTVTITPTYSGCPAMDAIKDDLEKVLQNRGFSSITIRLVLAPAWTTDWITETGRQALEVYGVAPPATQTERSLLNLSVRCTHCGSLNTQELSRFGSTACKSLWRCRDCAEPFDYFKAH